MGEQASVWFLLVFCLSFHLKWLRVDDVYVSLKKMCHFGIKSIDLGIDIDIEIVTKRLMLFLCVY